MKARYLPPAQRAFAADADGWQARYDAARELEEAARSVRVTIRCGGLQRALLLYARAQVAIAERADYPVKGPTPAPLPRVPATCVRAAPLPRARPVASFRVPPLARPEGATDPALARGLAAIGGLYPGWAGFWVHDLTTGRTAGWNADASFPAGSTVKLGPLVAALPYRTFDYDTEQIGAWSSNLAANRIVARLGLARAWDGLRRLGMWSSTYPGPYRAGTSARVDAPKPPPRTHTRVTTAHDLGRALYRLHAGAAGNRLALRQLRLTRPQARHALGVLLASRPLGLNRGLVRPWLPPRALAQKNAWLSDLRTTAAIVYGPRPTIVVVEVYRPGVTSGEARELGRRVVRLLRLDRQTR